MLECWVLKPEIEASLVSIRPREHVLHHLLRGMDSQKQPGAFCLQPFRHWVLARTALHKLPCGPLREETRRPLILSLFQLPG